MENIKLWQSEMIEYERKYKRIITAREKAMMKKLIEMFTDQIENDPGSFTMMIPEEFHEEFISYNENRAGNRFKYAMVTINFKNDVIVDKILKKIKKIYSKKWITHGIYCLETRDHEGNGVHAHLKINIKGKKKPSECQREIFNTVKHIVGNKLHVNIRYSNREGCFEDYIKGIKNGKHKQNYENDKRWRKLNDLEDFTIMEPRDT